MSTAVRCPALPVIRSSPERVTHGYPRRSPQIHSLWRTLRPPCKADLLGDTPGTIHRRVVTGPESHESADKDGEEPVEACGADDAPCGRRSSVHTPPRACTAPSTGRPQRTAPDDPWDTALVGPIRGVVPRIHRTYDNDESSPSRLLSPRMADGRSVDLGLGFRGGSPAAWSGRACQPVGDATLSAHARDRRAGNG